MQFFGDVYDQRMTDLQPKSQGDGRVPGSEQEERRALRMCPKQQLHKDPDQQPPKLKIKGPFPGTGVPRGARSPKVTKTKYSNLNKMPFLSF